MTYPQPIASIYSKEKYGFFRLNAMLTSPGDIYESEQSANAFAIGPDSDIANAVAVYLDDQLSPTQMNQIAFSANRQIVGTIYERGDATYAPANRPGRILFYCNDIYDPNFRPTGFSPDDDQISLITPVFDVMQYFAPQSSLGPARVDKRYLFQDYQPAGIGANHWIILPYYGRRYASICLQNTSASVAQGFHVKGINYGVVDDSQVNANYFHQEIAIKSGALAAGTPGLDPGKIEVTIAAGSNKAPGTGSIGPDSTSMFDAILIQLTPASGLVPSVLTRVTFSDIIGGQ